MNPPQLPGQGLQLAQSILSINTVVLITSITLLLQGGLIALSAYIISAYKGIREAAIASISISLGFFIIVLSTTGTIVIARGLTNGLIICGYLLFCLAIRLFIGKEKHTVVKFGFILLLLLFSIVPFQITPPAYLLFNRMSFGVVFSLLSGFHLLRNLQKDLKITTYLTAVPLLVYALALLGQIIISIINPEFARPNNPKVEVYSVLILFICSYVWSTGFILMVGQRLQNRLNDLAMNDALTRVRNRRAMDQLLEFEMERVKEEPRDFSIILLDIDHFKAINDSYGHETGDVVLQWFAATLQKSVRIQDVVARWGGEEFLILLPDTNLEEAFQIAERLRAMIATSDVAIPQGITQLTFSAGVSSSSEHRDVRLLCKVADDALYLAKVNRNEVKTQDDLLSA